MMAFKNVASGKWEGCMKMAIAYNQDVHPKKVKYIPPGTENYLKVVSDYIQDRFGKKMYLYGGEWCPPHVSHIEELLDSDQDWIAIVPGLSEDGRSMTTNNHAVCMKGDKIVYDSSQGHKRRRKPTKIWYGLVIE
jgi:hypothetical protein